MYGQITNSFLLLLFSLEQSHLDPNDPANADIMNIIKVVCCLFIFPLNIYHISFCQTGQQMS